MKPEEFRKHAHELVEWMASYMEHAGDYPVKSQVKPKEIFNRLQLKAPQDPESFTDLVKDLDEIIMPGISHWQSPDFYAYFPANSSPASVLAEMIIATLGVQGMVWETSPAAAELEEMMMNWLKDMTGLPSSFEGVIQDTASTATLAAILTARERKTGFIINEEGASSSGTLRVYCSDQTHSSIEKAVKIAGIGRKNLVKVKSRGDFSFDPAALEEAIRNDVEAGFIPCCVVATLGTTGTTAMDPVDEIGPVCRKYDAWLHVDAAMAGTALILPEFRWMLKGIDYVDSFVFNPHKWMFVNFDCTAYFVRDAATLIRTFEILPEYLKTRTRGQVNDYRDWGVPLGRRFRALKLWSVIRTYGVKGLQEKVRKHIEIAYWLKEQIGSDPHYELLAPVVISVVCFRYNPGGKSEEELNAINQKLNYLLNDSGKIYLSHTVLRGKYTLRMVTAQTNVTLEHVQKAWELIRSTAKEITSNPN